MSEHTAEIDLSKFRELKERECSDPADHDLIQEIEICAQSISKWKHYCIYHYSCLVDVVSGSNLRLDRLYGYRRGGDSVPVRIVYEANIVAFIGSLHCLLDSFPYLLNLIYATKPKSDTRVAWSEGFLADYKEFGFYDLLIDLWTDEDFQTVKGYANRIKHRHLIRIANTTENLEFESFQYQKQIFENEVPKKIAYSVPRQDAVKFISRCHDSLIPKFFSLCNAVIDCREDLLAIGSKGEAK